MEYQVSARRFRPGTFEDLLGQPHVVQTLKNAIAGKRVAHAYLFSGMRGVGKTTVARILSKALNCEHGPTPQPCERCESCIEITRGNSMDVIEIDGASNTGVDDIRELRENVKFAPFRGTYRIYIIDEVHMLSNSAFNALLKTLEEPPAHAIFVFATTEVHKIPATILSRCQHFNFRRIPRMEIVARLRHVAEQNGVTVEERSLGAIARASEGSMRDALSLLDQAVAFGGNTISYQDVEDMLGAVPDELIGQLVRAIMRQDSAAAVAVVGHVLDQGYDLRIYCSEVVERMRNFLVAAVVPSQEQARVLIDLPMEEVEKTLTEAKSFPVSQLQELFGIFSQVEDRLRGTAHPRYAFEAAVVRATRLNRQNDSGMDSQPDRIQGKVEGAKPKEESASLHSPTPHTDSQSKKADTGGASIPRQQGSIHRPGMLAEKKEPVRPSSAPQHLELAGKIQPRSSTAATVQPEPQAPDNLSLTNWAQVVDRVIQGHPNIGTFLKMGTLVRIDGNQVVIGYPKNASVACSRIQKEENRNVVGKAFEQLTGRPVQVLVIELSEGQGKGPTIGEWRDKQRELEDQALLGEVKAHPMVKQAVELFGVEVIQASRISVEKEAP